MAAKKKPAAKKPAAKKPAKSAKPAAKKAAPAKKAAKPAAKKAAPAKKAAKPAAKSAKPAAKKPAPAAAAAAKPLPKTASTSSTPPKSASSSSSSSSASSSSSTAPKSTTTAPKSTTTAPKNASTPPTSSSSGKPSGGKVMWHDLMTIDVDKARSFYTSLLSWKTRPVDLAPLGRTERIEAGGAEVGGLVSLPTSEGISSHWMPYVEVKDLDAVVRKAKELGGFAPVPPTPLDGMGRFAVIADPRGAHISPIEVASNAKLKTSKDKMPGPGQVAWNEVLSDDPDNTARFFAEVFGWEAKPSEYGGQPYTIFKKGEEMLAGCMKAPDNVPPQWLAYWTVNNVDQSVNRAKQLGARVDMPPFDMPNVGRMAMLADPTGAPFALFQASGS